MLLETMNLPAVAINLIPSDRPYTSLEKEVTDSKQLQMEVVNTHIASTSSSRNMQDVNKIPVSFDISSFRGPPSSLDVCMPVMKCQEPHPEVADRTKAREENSTTEYQSPTVVSSRVQVFVQRWGRVVPVHPAHFLHNILVLRGYDYNIIPTMKECRKAPSPEQVRDYDHPLLNAIRSSDLKTLQRLQQEGKSMSACNRFSESIVHMACRRASREVVEFLLDHGADLEIVDDFGRTPLHDACWRPEPHFDVVTVICDRNLDLLRHSDARGSMPLHYVREEHWVQWCAYLFNQIEKYWALRPDGVASTKKRKQNEMSDSAAVASVSAD